MVVDGGSGISLLDFYMNEQTKWIDGFDESLTVSSRAFVDRGGVCTLISDCSRGFFGDGELASTTGATSW